MRKIAQVRNASSGYARCILYASSEGAYVFPCATSEDGSATGDFWFQTIEAAEEFCLSEYGVRAEDWVLVEDPLPGCQHDWISPVRVKGRDNGAPEWGSFERLENGAWVPFDPK